MQGSAGEFKAKLRSAARAVRAAIPAAERRAASLAIVQQLLHHNELGKHARWFVYVSYRDEVETHDLIRSLLARGTEVSVPLLVENEGMVAARISGWSDLTPGKHGILTVRDSAHARDEMNPAIDVAIVPGLAFTAAGQRLGYGRGNYDRFFSQNHVDVRLGIAFDSQIIVDVSSEPHDVAMNLLVTEQRFLTCR